jgi:hypothetical protein
MMPLHTYAPQGIAADVILPEEHPLSARTGEHVILNLCSPNISFARRAA